MKSDTVTNAKRNRKIYGIIAAVVTLSFPFLLMLFNRDNHLETAQSFCPFKMLAGLQCPGCGMTKSMVYFYEGDFGKSFYYHAFGPFVIVFCFISIIVLATELKTGNEYFNILYNRKMVYVMAVLLVAYHIIRLVFL